MADAPTTLQIKVTLKGITPPIWRRLVVSGSTTLDGLHRILQVAMGWDNSHLHSFRIGRVVYGPDDDEDFDPDDIDESTITIAEAFGDNREGEYDYDFGDSWEHELLVERLDPLATLSSLAVCLDGERVCPPEDCGGTAGYTELLEALADPAHAEHAEYLEWVGKDFDPEAFDPQAVNVALNELE